MLSRAMIRNTILIGIIFLLVLPLVACVPQSSATVGAADSLSIDVQEVLLEAEAAFDSGDFDTAFELSQKAVQAAPDDYVAWEMVQQAAVAQAGNNYLQQLSDRRYRINPETFLIEQANGRNHFILDVREPDEFAESHIDGAINIPLQELLLNIEELPTTATPILIYCATQKRATHALVILRELGYVQVFNLEGGYSAYLDYITNNPLPGPGPIPTLPPVSTEGC